MFMKVMHAFTAVLYRIEGVNTYKMRNERLCEREDRGERSERGERRRETGERGD
jgi:hypothetical protein